MRYLWPGLLFHATLLLIGCSRDTVTIPAASTTSASATTQPESIATAQGAAMPKPSLQPEDVIKIQLTALQHNDTPTADAGIAIAYAFASPENKLKTGPLPKFIAMVKNHAYAPMLNFKAFVLGPSQSTSTDHQQLVTLITPDGQQITYVFILSKQSVGPFARCWMTNGVALLPKRTNPNSQVL